jgi:hypothetical protein
MYYFFMCIYKMELQKCFNFYRKFLEYFLKALMIVALYKSIKKGIIFTDVLLYSLLIALFLTFLEHTHKEYAPVIFNTLLITTVGACYVKLVR